MRKLIFAAAAVAAVSMTLIAPAEARRHWHHRGNCLAWYYTVCG